MQGFKGIYVPAEENGLFWQLRPQQLIFTRTIFCNSLIFLEKNNICSNNFRRFLHVIVTMFSERSIFISIYAIVTMFTIFVLDPNLVRTKI